MGKFDGVLIVSDFDSTLVGKDKRLSDKNREAIERFKAEGGLFTLATGRSMAALTGLLDQIPANAPIILDNGATIYDFMTGEELFQKKLSLESKEHCIQVAKEFPEVAIEAYVGTDAYAYNANEYTRIHLNEVKLKGIYCDLEDFPTPWTKALFQESKEYLMKVKKYIEDKWSGEYEVVFSTDFLLELTAAGTTKGDSVLRLLDRLGVSRENLYCIGDNFNDITMLKLSKVAFSVANATEEVLKIAEHVTSSCEESALFDVVEYLEKMY